MSNVSHTLANWEMSFQRFGSIQLPSSESVCKMFDLSEIPSHSGSFNTHSLPVTPEDRSRTEHEAGLGCREVNM